MPRITNKARKSASRFFASTMLALTLPLAAEAADLRDKLVVTEGVVRLSDIFTDTGAAGEEVVMAAPAPGGKVSISSYQLNQLADEHQLDWDRPAYLKRVYLHREGDAFSLNDLKDILLERARMEGVDGDVRVRVYGRKNGLFLPTGTPVEAIEIAEFRLNHQQDRFNATLSIPTGTSEVNELRINGQLEEVRLVPVLNRVVTPGEIIREQDIDWVKYPARRIYGNSVMDSSQLIGQTVKRALQSNRLLRDNDLMVPVAVEKGSIVLVTYQAGALTLSMQARALEDGGLGDTIRLMNQKSKKTVFGVVRTEDHVEVVATPTFTIASR